LIVSHDMILIGRGENVSDTADRIAVDLAATVLSTVHQKLSRLVNDRGERWYGIQRKPVSEEQLSDEERFWRQWQVLACIGVWGHWNTFAMLYLDEFGLHPAPSITEQWLFQPARQYLGRYPVPTGVDAPIIHQTSHLLNTSCWPIKGVSKTYAERALEGILQAEGHLEGVMAHIRPDGKTAGGLKKILKDNHLRLELPSVKGGAHGKFRTYKVVRDKLPSEVHLETSQDADLQLPPEPMIGGRWKNLDEALRERV